MILLAALAAAQAAPVPSPPRCRWEEKVGHATVVRFGPERDCAAWRAPRRHRGVWFDQFEGSAFIPDAHTVGEARRVGRAGVWLTMDERTEQPAACKPMLGHAYRIGFVGRDTAVPPRPGPIYGFGHMGMWPGQVLLDRVTAIEDLGALPGVQVRPVGEQPCRTFKGDGRRGSAMSPR